MGTRPKSAAYLLGFQSDSLSFSTLQNGKMESLSETKWDVVINGTGLQQSLLAL